MEMRKDPFLLEGREPFASLQIESVSACAKGGLRSKKRTVGQSGSNTSIPIPSTTVMSPSSMKRTRLIQLTELSVSRRKRGGKR